MNPHPWIERTFPRLKDSLDYEVISPQDNNYNCIAFAAGDTERWWWPSDPFPVGAYWPTAAPVEETLSAFVAAFECLGYRVCEDGNPESAMEKIALYTKDGRPSHAARQVVGTPQWLSKLGRAWDIRHTDVNSVGGSEYGEVACFMSRPAPD